MNDFFCMSEPREPRQSTRCDWQCSTASRDCRGHRAGQYWTSSDARRSLHEPYEKRGGPAYQTRFSAARGRVSFIHAIQGITHMTTIAGIHIPDSIMAREATDLVRDTETELLYIGAMFHDMGLVAPYSSEHERFEVDGANAARDFLRRHGIGEDDIEQVWTSIALHTTPVIPQHMKPVVALVTAGVEMDVLGLAYYEFTEEERQAVTHAHPRGAHFKENIIDAFTQGIIHKPHTTFGNVKADVLELKDPHYHRENFCTMILGSSWKE
ncbi:MAG: FIG00453401: hypothetical protein [uncultured Paraburkholderia sp.]|nr:MAG: FIG00453401: hypothetical protein [uncultured Paraburkholderia sp.]CAH2798050.1 MAG: FIG00453401: hypothetical protein [uncultured Paraburkholderia sp.]